MTEPPKDRGGRPRRWPDTEAGRAARAEHRRAVAKAHLQAVRARTTAKTADLSDETIVKVQMLQLRRGLRSFTALVTQLVDDAYDPTPDEET